MQNKNDLQIAEENLRFQKIISISINNLHCYGASCKRISKHFKILSNLSDSLARHCVAEKMPITYTSSVILYTSAWWLWWFYHIIISLVDSITSIESTSGMK